MHGKGHEIGVFSFTNDEDSHWVGGENGTNLMEMAGQRLIIKRFANITDETVVGVRTPSVLIRGDEQFAIMDDQLFSYDYSIIAPLSSVPFCLTLHFR